MSNEDKPQGLNILCIDGGGARGLSSLVVLQEVMNRLEGLSGGDMALKPADCFDVIAGSGTGGLSACMLGRLRMPLNLAIQEYAELIKGVFADKKIIRTSGPSTYKGTKLREALQQIVAKSSKDGEKMEEQDTREGCKTIVFAMSKHNMNASLPIMFRSYRVAANRGPDCTILDALYATMAHPNLFKDIEIEEGALRQSFISGDLGCSNPMKHVLDEVKRVYPGRHVSCILSIGAGHARTISIPDYGLPEQIFRIQDLVAMKNMAMDSERVAEEMAIRFGATRGVYFRFSVDQGVQDMEPDDWERLGDVMAHSKAYLHETDTDQRMKELVQTIEEKNNMLEVELIDGQVQQRRQVRRAARSRKCPAPTPVYTGRKDEAKQVIGCILNDGDERPICVIYGLGGSGKTQLALKVVEQTRNQWVEVLYVDGTSRETIESSLKGFSEAKNVGHAYQDAMGWLESCLGRWLIVFDNLDEPSTHKHIHNYIPSGTHGSILITTRLVDLKFLAKGPGSACHISPGMKPEESLALLTKVAGLTDQHLPDVEMKEAVALLEDFGYLALAIVHAGAYIGHSAGLKISKYRKLFRSQRQRMLEGYSKLFIRVDDYTKTVYTTWEMCYNLLRRDSRPMLWLMAFLHHNFITEEIFERATTNILDPRTRIFLIPPTETVKKANSHVKQYLSRFFDPTSGWDSPQFLEVIGEIASYSLIEFDRMNDAYNIHVLVQDWVKIKIEQEPELALECTAALLSLSIGFDESRNFLVGLEIHLNCFLSNKRPTAHDYHRQFAKVYQELKQWQRVEDLESNVYREMNQALGEKHVYTPGCMIDLASTYLIRGSLNQAEDLQTKALNIQKEVLGLDHPHTQRSITNLASIYLKQGRLDDAEQLQLHALNPTTQQPLPLPRNPSGPSQEVMRFEPLAPDQQELIVERDYLNMLRAKANLASVHSNRGRLSQAENLQIEVLNAYLGKFTEEHLDTIASMLNLASTYCKQSRWDESEGLLLRAAELQTKILGKEEPDTLKGMTELAAIYSKQGQWTKAETLQQRVVHTYKHALGAENPDTLRAMAALAITYSGQHNWAEAETLQGHVVESHRRILGAKHPDTLKAMSELAVIHSKQDHWGKAEPLQEHVLSSYEQTSHKHRDMMAVLTGLIVTYSKEGRSDRATTLLNRAQDQCKQVLDKQKSGTQISIVEHGVFHLGRRLARKAELQERILDIHVQLLRDHNLDTESDIEIMTILLAYLEAHAWFLHSPESKPESLLALLFVYLCLVLWIPYAFHQLTEVEYNPTGWLDYVYVGLIWVFQCCATVRTLVLFREESLGGLKFKIDEIDRLREIVRCRTDQVEGNKASSEDPLKAPRFPSVPSIPLANSNKTTRGNRTTGDDETTNKGTVSGSVGSASGMALKPTSPTPGPGTLKVTLHRAKDLAKIKKGDIAKPFVILRIGDKDHKSKHVKSNTPEWNESFSFPNVSTNTRTLHVAIKDKRTFGKDPTLAKGTIDIWCYIQLLSTPPILSAEVTAQLDDNSGTLQLRLDFESMQNTLKIIPPSRFRLNQLYSKEKKLP